LNYFSEKFLAYFEKPIFKYIPKIIKIIRAFLLLEYGWVIMKTYRITIKDPNVQRWFNYLFDNAELSTTVEFFAAEHIRKISNIEIDMQKLEMKEPEKKQSWITKHFLKNPLTKL